MSATTAHFNRRIQTLQSDFAKDKSLIIAPERSLLHTQSSNQENELMQDHSTNQQDHIQQIEPFLCDIYEKLFGSDQLQLAFNQNQSSHGQVYREIWENIIEEIKRLQSIQLQFSQILHIFQAKTSKMTNEDKWKMIVISYREKLAKLETKLQEERKAKQLLQETVRLQAEEKDRLGHLNNMKFKKINALIAEKQHQQQQINFLNESISNLKSEINQSKQSNSQLLIQLQETSRAKEQLMSQLTFVKQQSLLAERQTQFINKQLKILGQEEESVNKQIMDLKTKYEIEIAKLQNTVSNLTIEREEHLMLIDELQRKTHHSSTHILKLQAQTQTETQTTKVEFYNSLADQLDEDSFDSKEEEYQEEDQHNFSCELGRGKQQVLSQGEPVNDNEFQIPLGSLSASQHIVFTDRTASGRGPFENQQNCPKQQASFDQCHSFISNTPSKYLQTMGQLTAELAEAYQKINELTEKVTILQGQKCKIETKLKDKGGKSKSKQKQQGFGYFSSFFKK